MIEIDGTLYNVKKDCLGEEEMKSLLMSIKRFIWDNIGDYDDDVPEFAFQPLEMLSVIFNEYSKKIQCQKMRKILIFF